MTTNLEPYSDDPEVRKLQQEHEARAHRDVTIKQLAILLIAMLGITVVTHYIVVAILVIRGKDVAAEALNRVFNIWLPVISGLVGAAVGYYFGRDR